MKKILFAIGLAGCLFSNFANALTSTTTLPVVITLTPACTFTSTNIAFAYTSFQLAAQLSTGGSVTANCPKTLVVVPSLDSNAVTDAETELAYTLTTPAAPSYATTTTQTFSIPGSMIAGQAGKCGAGPSCANTDNAGNNRTRTLTFTF